MASDGMSERLLKPGQNSSLILSLEVGALFFIGYVPLCSSQFTTSLCFYHLHSGLEKYTIGMQTYEDSNLLRGFRYRPMQNPSSSNSGTRNSMTSKILLASNFRHWSDLDMWVVECSQSVAEAVALQGCTPSNHDPDHCQGCFRNWAKCQFGICRYVAEAKLQLQQSNNLTSEGMLRHTHYVVLRNFKNVAKKINRHWHGDVKERRKVVGYDEVRPSLSVIQPGVSHPYFTMSVTYPNHRNMIPRLRSGISNLAAMYNELVSKKPTSSGMSFMQNCIAQAIQDAMFTGTGFGCLFNHNQAVFLKVAPECTQKRNYTQVRHRVYISREFKCDTEDISIFHGILTMMLKGHQDEKQRTFIDLQKYYRMLKISEYSRDRTELRCQRSSGENVSSHGGWGVPGESSSS